MGSLSSLWGSNVASTPPLLLQQSPTSEMGQCHLQSDKIPKDGIRDMLEDALFHEQAHRALAKGSQCAGNTDLHQQNLLPSTGSKLHSRICHSPILEMNYVAGPRLCFWQALRESFVPHWRFIFSLGKWCWSRAEQGAGVGSPQTLGQCSSEELCTGVH